MKRSSFQSTSFGLIETIQQCHSLLYQMDKDSDSYALAYKTPTQEPSKALN
jgi:hypothetical protein